MWFTVFFLVLTLLRVKSNDEIRCCVILQHTLWYTIISYFVVAIYFHLFRFCNIFPVIPLLCYLLFYFIANIDPIINNHRCDIFQIYYTVTIIKFRCILFVALVLTVIIIISMIALSFKNQL